MLLLCAVSFRVASGDSLALVGPTGSGKSTVVRLIYRLYDPESGTIRLHDLDLKSLTQRSIRSEMGMVPQDCVLFNDTIEYNIRQAKPSLILPQHFGLLILVCLSATDTAAYKAWE